MGAMRMSDYYLAETMKLCEWTIQHTDPTHKQNIRAKGLIHRIMRFINETQYNGTKSHHDLVSSYMSAGKSETQGLPGM